MKHLNLPVLLSILLVQSPCWADVTYRETTQITGGSLKSMMKLAGAFSSQARQAAAPTTSTVSIHGNRMLQSNVHTSEIIDLDQRSITSTDHDKKTYTIVTFDQMKQAMEKAAAGAKQQKNARAEQPANGEASMSFNAHLSSNGSKRTIDGREANEELLTVTMISNANDGSNVKAGMAATSEMWLVPDVPGMEELKSFNERLAKELAVDMGGNQMSGMLAAQPGGAEAMAELKKESLKASGFPVLQVTRVGVSTDGQPLPAPSVAPVSQGSSHDSQVASAGKEIATNTGTQTANDQIGKLGGFGRALGSSTLGSLMHHKSSAPPPTSTQSDSANSAAAAGVLLESQTETSGFSSAPVDPTQFDIPAGYKQIASPLTRQ